MRMQYVVSAVVLGLCALPLTVEAQPVEPKIKFWVQTPRNGATDAAALVQCTGGDPRFFPIIRMEFPSGGVDGGTLWGSLTAQKAIEYNQLRINAGFPPISDKSIALMLVGYGEGRLGIPVPSGTLPGPLNHNPPWHNAPYLAKPADWQTTTQIGTGAPNDWINAPSFCWKTPWFEEGPQDLSNWFGDFATAYSATIQNAQLANQSAFQPARLIFDAESPNSSEAWWIDGADTGLDALLGIGFGQSQPDPRRLSLPVRGVPRDGMFDYDGPWRMNEGAAIGIDDPPKGTLNDLRQACVECDFNPYARWEWFNSVMTQTQNAAFARSVKWNFGSGSAISKFTLSSTVPLFTNFNWQTSDYILNDNFPPYLWNGDPARRFSERTFPDNGTITLSESYHNYADFNAPVSYGYGTTFVPALAPGQSKSDYVLQFAREKFESVLLSEEPHTVPGGLTTFNRPSYYITPWVAAMNLYMVNADHHRKLLALARAKNCQEFNLFMPVEASTDARCAQNLVAYRRIIDQVWGIGLVPQQTLAAVVSTGTPVNTVNPSVTILPKVDSLELGDAIPLSIESMASGTIGLPYQNMVRLAPRYELRPQFLGAGVWGMESVRTSPLVRVNIEVNIRWTDNAAPSSFPFRGTPAYWDLINSFSTSVKIKRYTTLGATYVTVPMTMVGAEPGFSPAYGFRYTLTGLVSNKNASLFTPGFINPLNPAKCDLLIEFGGPTPFVAHVDLVQVIGADADDLEFDWNHDGAQNGGDLLPFAEDFLRYRNGSLATESTGKEHFAFDMNNDGSLSPSDLCAFYTIIKSVGTVTEQDCQAFAAFLSQRGISCDLGTPPCSNGPMD